MINKIFEINAASAKPSTYLKNEIISGVYIWGYLEGNVFLPLYVGKSRNLHERALQHYCRFSGGEYKIFDPKDIYECHINNNAMKLNPIYTPQGINSVINELPIISEKHNKMIANFVFRGVEIEDHIERECVERLLADYVGRNRLMSFVAANKGRSNPSNYTNIFKQLLA